MSINSSGESLDQEWGRVQVVISGINIEIEEEMTQNMGPSLFSTKEMSILKMKCKMYLRQMCTGLSPRNGAATVKVNC